MPVGDTSAGPDPFDTAGLRELVLRTWTAAPARFREDANAEERLALDYGGRVLAELAANAADAARAAGVPGELVVALRDRELRVANSGAPLTADGVAALAALRSSSKREDGSVGHFGVGFTAVRALSDEPVVASAAGGVCFSAAGTASAVAGLAVPALDREMRRRGGLVPALRLPWPALPAAGLPAPCVTEVRLPLRAGIDPDELAAQLTVDVAMDLLWALPDLAAVTVPGHRVTRTADPADPSLVQITVTDGAEIAGSAETADGADGADTAAVVRCRIQQATGTLPPDLLADRPVEERARDRWHLTWVLPLDPAGRPEPVPRSVIGAPTPTDEPLGLPARLVGTLPVDEGRSRIAPGPLTDHMVGRAADAYRDLVLALAPPDRPALIPPAGFPLGDVDAALRGAVTDRLQRTAFLAGAGGASLSPQRACLVAGVTGAAAACIAEAMPGLLAWTDSPAQVERLRSVGVRVEPLPAVTAALAQLDRPVGFWQQVYQGLAGSPVEQLADLPVPRRGGGTIVGPRTALLTDGGEAVTGRLADRVARLLPGLRLAAAGADHPLLRRLGATPADASAVVTDPAFAGEIRRRLDDLDYSDPDPADLREFAAVVLDLLDAGPGTEPVELADVLLTDSDGEPWPAGALLLPDAPLAGLLVADADLPLVGADWIAEYGADRLARLGVRSGFGVRRYLAPPGPDTDLPDVVEWADETSPEIGETFEAVPDLDLIADDAWPAALALLASDPATRRALRGTAAGPSYTAWWLRRNARVSGVPLGLWRAPGAAALAGLYDELPVPLRPDVAGDLGVLGTLADAAANPRELLARWADPVRAVLPGRVPAITAALVAAMAAQPDLDLPAGVRTIGGGVVDAGRAAVLDQPWLAQVLAPNLLVAGGPDPVSVADLLDLPLASERYRTEAVTGPSAAPATLGTLPAAARCLQAFDRCDLGEQPVIIDPDLAVRDGRRVAWWSGGDRLLLDGSAGGIARAVAHLLGRWPERHRLAAVAAGGDVALAEAGLD